MYTWILFRSTSFFLSGEDRSITSCIDGIDGAKQYAEDDKAKEEVSYHVDVEGDAYDNGKQVHALKKNEYSHCSTDDGSLRSGILEGLLT